MNKWTELRTAYKLAQYQTLSATAEDIGVHRSTVMRHVDALEEELGVTLFQRSDKGYIPTEAGLEIMQIGEVTDNHFSQLTAQIQSKEQELEGKITITAVNEMASMIMPAITEYQNRYPGMRVEFIGDIRNYNLEYGEADIAIRGGEKPTTPDNIVFPLTTVDVVLCAHRSYIEKMGMPDINDLHQHKFIAMKERPTHLHWNEWIHDNIPENNIVFLCSTMHVAMKALEAGTGICILAKDIVDAQEDFIEVAPDLLWQLPLWALIHRDMYHLTKIKAFTDILRQIGPQPVDLRM